MVLEWWEVQDRCGVVTHHIYAGVSPSLFLVHTLEVINQLPLGGTSRANTPRLGLRPRLPEAPIGVENDNYGN